jgi:outer membrane protein OmpA-like peptidoglycan-associated protein
MALAILSGCGGSEPPAVEPPPPAPPPTVVAVAPPPPPTVDVAPPPPPPPPPVVVVERIVVEDDRVRLNEEILFKTGSAEMDPKSEEFVGFIAMMLNEHIGLDYIEVAGHADKRGGDAENLKLTQKRAEEVVKHLIADGVNPLRLRGVGYSSYCPIDPADNDAAYAKNRRVEFRILRRDGRDLNAKWDGCDEALKHALKPIPIPKTAPKTKIVWRKGKIKRHGVQLAFPDEVRFDPNSAKLSAGSEGPLEELRAFLAADKVITKIRIEGHTDSPTNTPEMVALSKRRSKAVAEWLVNKGIAPEKILPVGCGSNRPIKTGGQVDHAKSKRTEAYVIEEKGKPLGAAPVPSDCSVD